MHLFRKKDKANSAPNMTEKARAILTQVQSLYAQLDEAMDQGAQKAESIDQEIIGIFLKYHNRLGDAEQYLAEKVRLRRISSTKLHSATLSPLVLNRKKLVGFKDSCVKLGKESSQTPLFSYPLLRIVCDTISCLKLPTSRINHISSISFRPENSITLDTTENTAEIPQTPKSDGKNPNQEAPKKPRKRSYDPWVLGSKIGIDRDPSLIPLSPVGVLGGYIQPKLQMGYPRGLCVHPVTGMVYVCSWEKRTVLGIYPSPDMQGSDPSPHFSVSLEDPCGMCISHDGEILCVTHFNRNTISLMDKKLIVLQTLTSEVVGRPLPAPHFASFDEEGNLYVLNAWKEVLKLEAKTYKYLAHYEIKESFGIVVNDDDEVVVASRGSDQLVVLSSSLTPLRTIKIDMTGGNWNCLSRGPMGGFVLCDYALSKVSIYSPTGDCWKSIQATNPVSASFGINQELYVTAYHGNRVDVY